MMAWKNKIPQNYDNDNDFDHMSFGITKPRYNRFSLRNEIKGAKGANVCAGACRNVKITTA